MNFAVKATYLKSLLEVLPDAPDLAQVKTAISGMSLERQVEILAPYVVRVSGSRGSGQPLSTSAPQTSDAPDTVYLMEGGVIYHRKDCVLALT